MRMKTAAVAALLAAVAATGAARADGDADKGETVFRKCKACHKVEEGKNGVGPSLFGVVGRPVATAPGFSYSQAMTSFGAGKTWTPELLTQFLTKPSAEVPGTRMGFPGLNKPTDIADVIAYLSTVK